MKGNVPSPGVKLRVILGTKAGASEQSDGGDDSDKTLDTELEELAVVVYGVDALAEIENDCEAEISEENGVEEGLEMSEFEAHISLCLDSYEHGIDSGATEPYAIVLGGGL